MTVPPTVDLAATEVNALLLGPRTVGGRLLVQSSPPLAVLADVIRVTRGVRASDTPARAV